MGTRARYRSGELYFYESLTQERVAPFSPVLFEDDFLGTGLLTTDGWTVVDVSVAGNTTPLIAADVANGVARLPLDVTSEAQESGLTWGDQRPLVLNQALMIEMRVALQTLPTLLSEAVWGLAGDKNAAADSVAESVWFKADGNGVIVVESDDTSNTDDDVATGTTLTAGTFAIFRIDLLDITDVQFFIDGARVASGTTFDMSQVAALKLQPYFHIAKASGAGLGVLDVDYCRVWQKRS
ncbi:MAG: hypothetical protein IH904_00045 [Proteobacteria bacterium]|nr:hypothetical protein [Pseudomonadota bacterium]